LRGRPEFVVSTFREAALAILNAAAQNRLSEPRSND
jgi:hypothetical protein